MSAKWRIPIQLEGWSCFMRKPQHASVTSDSCSRQAVDSSASTVSSRRSILPEEGKVRCVITGCLPIFKDQFKTFLRRFRTDFSVCMMNNKQVLGN